MSQVLTTVAATSPISRQPIYDRRLKVFAYELLSQTGSVRALVDTGVDFLVGKKTSFISVNEDTLLSTDIWSLPRERLIIRLDRSIAMSGAIVDRIDELSKGSYKVMVDHDVFIGAHDRLIGKCRVVRIDLNSIEQFALRDTVVALKAANVRLFAEGVESMEVYNRCLALGFDYFHGYFFAKPALVAGRGIPPSRSVLIHLLTRLQDPLVKLDEIEVLVSSDEDLTDRLLTLVNSAIEGVTDHVETVRAALVLLGLDKVVSLVSLLSMSGIRDKPAELLTIAMVRAKMCESLAEEIGRSIPEKYFTVGLLSVIEAMFDLPMAELLQQLPLTPDMKSALLDSKSDNLYSEILRVVLEFERGNWQMMEGFKADQRTIAQSYLNAVAWADEATKALAA